MSRPDPLQPAARLNDPLHLLEPLGAAVSTVAQPGALAIGLGVGAAAGALAGLAGGLAFIRSPAALVVVPLAALLLLVLWPCALGAAALIADRATDERDTSAGRALRDAWRQVPALALASLPLLLLVGALAVVQVAVFGFTRPPDTVITSERPVAFIAAIFVVLFLLDAVVLAGVNVFLWTVIPQVIVAGRPAGAAYNEVFARLRERPAWTVTSMAGVLILAGMVTGVGLGGVVLALAAVSAAQLAGATELILLRFWAPLVQGSFAVSAGDFVAVVIVFTGLGAAIGAAAGLGHMFGVAGGAGLLRASADSTH
ncbi:MAG: hypothetical protein OXG65_02255 [Chloroflexi bacterium]|nr:hypothetical protein [Chloroflexota bacterium]